MSVLTDTRLRYLRHTTNRFIQDDPKTIVLQRQTKVRKPGGGHDFPKAPIAAQDFRFINQDITSGLAGGQDDGTARRFSYVLVGKHDADVDINDTFTDGDIPCKVMSIIPNNGWETRFYVVAYADEPEHG